jgi:hypothetical protein
LPEFIDPVFAKTSPKHSFSVNENERFGLVFEKTGSIISGIGLAGKFSKFNSFVKDDTAIDQSRNNKVLRHWSVAFVYKFLERKKKVVNCAYCTVKRSEYFLYSVFLFRDRFNIVCIILP